MPGFLLISLTKLSSRVLKILNYDGLWENKNLLDESRRFGWINRSIDIDWLILFDSLILTCLTQ